MVFSATALTGCHGDGKDMEAQIDAMKFVKVPRGTFWMGWDSEKKQSKQVEIPGDFELAAYTVTQEQWQALMGNNPSLWTRERDMVSRGKKTSDVDFKRSPVETVSWNDVQEFIKKLNQWENGRRWWYRLPTEAEWEYACRGAATSKEECSFDFYFDKPTNDLSQSQARIVGAPAGNGADVPSAAAPWPAVVGSFTPNKLGLYDMHGNVGQWCEDVGKGSPEYRVVRGAGWQASGWQCRAAGRYESQMASGSGSYGFRLARVPTSVK
jgi:formylglycine-generating enzyme required for sulfatase activity